MSWVDKCLDTSPAKLSTTLDTLIDARAELTFLDLWNIRRQRRVSGHDISLGNMYILEVFGKTFDRVSSAPHSVRVCETSQVWPVEKFYADCFGKGFESLLRSCNARQMIPYLTDAKQLPSLEGVSGYTFFRRREVATFYKGTLSASRGPWRSECVSNTPPLKGVKRLLSLRVDSDSVFLKGVKRQSLF